MIKLFDLVCGDRCLSYIGNTSDEFVVACCSKDKQWDVVLHVSNSRSDQFSSITRASTYHLAFNDNNQIVFTNGCVGCIVDSMEVRRRGALKGIPVMLPKSLIMTVADPKILQFTDLFGSRRGLSLSGYHLGAQSWAVFECRGNPVYVQMNTTDLAQLLDVLDALPEDHTTEFSVESEPQQLYMSVYDATETEVSPERAFDFIHMDIIAPNVPLHPGQLYMARGISKENHQFAILTDYGETMVFNQHTLRGVHYPEEHVLGKRYIATATAQPITYAPEMTVKWMVDSLDSGVSFKDLSLSALGLHGYTNTWVPEFGMYRIRNLQIAETEPNGHVAVRRFSLVMDGGQEAICEYQNVAMTMTPKIYSEYLNSTNGDLMVSYCRNMLQPAVTFTFTESESSPVRAFFNEWVSHINGVHNTSPSINVQLLMDELRAAVEDAKQTQVNKRAVFDATVVSPTQLSDLREQTTAVTRRLRALDVLFSKHGLPQIDIDLIRSTVAELQWDTPPKHLCITLDPNDPDPMKTISDMLQTELDSAASKIREKVEVDRAVAKSIRARAQILKNRANDLKTTIDTTELSKSDLKKYQNELHEIKTAIRELSIQFKDMVDNALDSRDYLNRWTTRSGVKPKSDDAELNKRIKSFSERLKDTQIPSIEDLVIFAESEGLHLVPMSVGHDGDTVSPSDCDIVLTEWPTFLTEPGIQFPSKTHKKEDVMTKTEPAGQAYEFATPTKEPVTTLPLYQCHKEVRASKILEIDPRIQEISHAETPKYTTYTVVTEHGSVELRFEEASRLAKVLAVGSYLVAYKPAGEHNPIALEKVIMKAAEVHLEHLQEPFRRDAIAALTKHTVVKHSEICNDISYWYKSVSPAAEFENGYSAK